MKNSVTVRVNGIRRLGRKPLLVKKERTAGHWKAYKFKGLGGDRR